MRLSSCWSFCRDMLPGIFFRLVSSTLPEPPNSYYGYQERRTRSDLCGPGSNAARDNEAFADGTRVNGAKIKGGPFDRNNPIRTDSTLVSSDGCCQCNLLAAADSNSGRLDPHRLIRLDCRASARRPAVPCAFHLYLNRTSGDTFRNAKSALPTATTRVGGDVPICCTDSRRHARYANSGRRS